MARIIAFPKIHPRFRVPTPVALRTRNWPAWGVALLVCAVAAPSSLVPSLCWLLVVDVLIQLARIVFMGGLAAMHGLMHLAALGMSAALVIALAGDAQRQGGGQQGQR